MEMEIFQAQYIFYFLRTIKAKSGKNEERNIKKIQNLEGYYDNKDLNEKMAFPLRLTPTPTSQSNMGQLHGAQNAWKHITTNINQKYDIITLIV